MKSTLISFSLITVINYKVTATSFVNSRKVSCPNFGKRTENAMLNVSILTAFPAELEVQCMGQCILHDQCFSYNFVPEDHGFRCELSGMDRFSGRDNFLSKSGSIHRGLVVSNSLVNHFVDRKWRFAAKHVCSVNRSLWKFH